MGNTLEAYCCGETYKPDVNLVNVPEEPVHSDLKKYPRNRFDAQRLGEPIFTKKRESIYNFLMTVRTEKTLEQISLDIVILRELVDCILYEYYEFEIDNMLIIDIFEIQSIEKYFTSMDSSDHIKFGEQIYIPVRHKKSRQKYSMKIYGFKTYQDDLLRRGLYEIYLHNTIGQFNSSNVMKLLHYFIIDRAPLQKALVFLFESVSTSLSNIIEYRNLNREPWKDDEIQNILKNIFVGYNTLQKCHIYHRDLRPSRIFYSKYKKQYFIGNLSDAIEIKDDAKFRNTEQENWDLLTVRGIHYFNSNRVQQIMEQDTRCGNYNPKQNDYEMLAKLLHYIQTLKYEGEQKQLWNLRLYSIPEKLKKGVEMEVILKDFSDVEGVGTHQENVLTINLETSSIHSKLIHTIMLNCYFHLHYNDEFSKLAHGFIDSNIEMDKKQNNAHIFMRLGQYYSSAGNHSEDYFANAFLLFVKRAANKRKMGFFQDALHELTYAKRCYGSVTDTDYRVKFYIELGLTKLRFKQLAEARNIINEAIQESADNSIAPDLEIELILAKGIIYLYTDELDEGEKFLKYGLTLCENKDNFEQREDEQNKFKGEYFMVLGQYYLRQAYQNHENIQSSNSVISQSHHHKRHKYLAKAERFLLMSLELKEHSSTENISMAELRSHLGELYYGKRDAYKAKKQYQEALLNKLYYKQQLCPFLLVETYYDIGNCCSKLSELPEAQEYYTKAIEILQDYPEQKHLKLVIEGNLNIALCEMGRLKQGWQNGNRIAQELRLLVKEDHVDYIFLKTSLQRFKEMYAENSRSNEEMLQKKSHSRKYLDQY